MLKAASFPRLVFRVDDSRPQWRRDALDGLLDYHVVGSAMRQYPRWASTASAGSARSWSSTAIRTRCRLRNLQPVGWTPDVWSLGADGVLPWQTIGTARSWQQGDELSLFYPLPDASRAGRLARTTSPPGAELGVVPSIRLKAYRRGQQDVEYLTLWSRQCGLPRGTVGRQVRAVLHLSGSRQATETGGAEDAGRIDYSGLCPQDLWALRCASARPCPWLIQQPNRDSSTFALRHEIRLRAGRN